jgi:hypothetical protein
VRAIGGSSSRESLRIWVKQAENDDGKRKGLTSEERNEMRRLRHEMRLLLEARDPKEPRTYFARRADRVKVLPLHRDETGARPILLLCRVLGVSRSPLPGWECLSPSKAALADGCRSRFPRSTQLQ